MEQSRRQFFRSMIGGIAATAAVRSWPFRVYSFPSAIERPCWTVALGDTNLYRVGDPLIVTMCNPSQADAWAKLIYKITKIDRTERTVTIEKIRQSRYNWQGLSRSSSPRRAGVT